MGGRRHPSGAKLALPLASNPMHCIFVTDAPPSPPPRHPGPTTPLTSVPVWPVRPPDKSPRSDYGDRNNPTRAHTNMRHAAGTYFRVNTVHQPESFSLTLASQRVRRRSGPSAHTRVKLNACISVVCASATHTGDGYHVNLSAKVTVYKRCSRISLMIHVIGVLFTGQHAWHYIAESRALI